MDYSLPDCVSSNHCKAYFADFADTFFYKERI